jgi:DNA-binding transcriptional ArsR family regulator
MRRSKPKKRLAKVLPVVAVALGAGLKAMRKRKGARGVGDGPVSHSVATVPGLEPIAPIDATPQPIPPSPEAEATPKPRTTATAVLEVLATGGAMTAGEVAVATGRSRSAISSTLSRLTRSGEVSKAERGYQLASTPRPRPTTKAARAPSKPSQLRARTRAADEPVVGNTAARNARGHTRAAVLAALSDDRALTSGEVATATGLSRSTVSTTLSRLAKTGEVVKAERGYLIPG